MSWQAWYTVGVVLVVLVLLMATRKTAFMIVLGGATALLLAGVIDEAQLLNSFANEGMVTVGVLFAVVAGLRETGAMTWLGQIILGKPKSLPMMQFRVMAPIAALSAFMNNTPLVAMMLPVLNDWSRKIRVSVSQLLIPLSFAAILGGTCTLIGTSRNLVVNGLMIDEAVRLKDQGVSLLGLPEHGMGMFTVSVIAVPAAIVGIVYLLVVSRWLLPERQPVISPDDDARQYTVEMVVEENGPLVGKTIEEADLRQLPGLFLTSIYREEQILPAVSANVQLQAHDQLIFAGDIESIVDLQKIRGLLPAHDQIYKLDEPRPNRCLIEAVVSDTCPVVGRTIREGRFRTRYNAVVIAVARNGQRLRGKLGNIVLRAGDTLLLETRPAFVDQHRNSRDFYLISSVEDSAPVRHEKAMVALTILIGMVLVVTFTPVSMLKGALAASLLMVGFRCCTTAAALRNIDWQVLIIIASAIALGTGMKQSGAAQSIAEGMMQLGGNNAYLALGIICAVTMLFTNIMNAYAAIAIVFPIAIQTATQLNTSAMPFAMSIIMGATGCFATPISYQTNLMVYGPGGYRFSDYVRIGLPLCLIILVLSVVLIPVFWPF